MTDYMSTYNGGKHCFGQGFFRRLKAAFPSIMVAAYVMSAIISMAAAQAAPQCQVNTARQEILRNAASGDVLQLLRPAETPWYAGDLAFEDVEGKEKRLADFKGKTLLVNLWAVWCAPCREEMPELAALYEKMKGADFDVIAINVDRKPEGKVPEFLHKVGAERLPLYLDKSMATFNAARHQGLARGLPLTLLVDENGCLLASFNGAARWGNADSASFIQAVLQSRTKDSKGK